MPPMGDGGIESVEKQSGKAYFDQNSKQIMADAADGTKVQVYTMGGMLAGEYTISGGSAGLDGLQDGVYIARINANGKIMIVKCVL